MLELPKTREDLGWIVGGSALSALLFLLGASFSPLLRGLSGFVQLPLFYLGLSRNASAQFYASLLTFLLVALLTNIQNGVASLFVTLAPAMLLTYLVLLRQQGANKKLFWYPPGRLIAALTVYALGLLVLFFGISSKSDYMATLNAHLIQMAPPNLQAHYNKIIMFLPSLVSLGSILTTLLNAILMQSILIKVRKNVRPRFFVSAIELPWWPWIALALFGVVILVLKGIGKQFFMNETLVLLFAFLFEGLGIVHILLARYAPRKMFLWIFYIGMILFGWPILMVIALGLFEPWLKMRERLASR